MQNKDNNRSDKVICHNRKEIIIMTLVPRVLGEDLFDDFMSFPFDDPFFNRKKDRPAAPAQPLMKTDIKETETGYELDIDLPGYSKDDVKLSLKEGYLTVKASRTENNDEKDSAGNYIRRERYTGSMSRSFYVGDAVKADEVKAKYEDGILKLSVPKKDPKAVETENYIAIEG